MGRIIRQKPISLSARAEGIVLEEQGGALLVRSGGWPGVFLSFDNPGELYQGESKFEATDGAFIVRTFERIFITFPENVGPLDLELELFPCGLVSLNANERRGDPPARIRFPAVKQAIPELVGGSQPYVLADFGPASEALAGDLARSYFLPDQFLGGIVRANQTFVLDFFAYLDADQDRAQALYVGGWSVIKNTVTNRAELVLEEGGMTRSTDAIRMTGPTLIPPFGGFVQIRTTGLTDLTGVDAIIYSRSR